jgi:hypothetical protein
MGPTPHQSTGLIFEVRQLDLKLTFGGRGPLPKNLENQPRAVDDLGADLVLEIFLLDRRKRRIENQEMRVFFLRKLGDLLDLALAQLGRRPD